MADITKVKLVDLNIGSARFHYQEYIDTALAMSPQEAVLVDIQGPKTLHSNVVMAILSRGLRGQLRARMVKGKTYIVKV